MEKVIDEGSKDESRMKVGTSIGTELKREKYEKLDGERVSTNTVTSR